MSSSLATPPCTGLRELGGSEFPRWMGGVGEGSSAYGPLLEKHTSSTHLSTGCRYNSNTQSTYIQSQLKSVAGKQGHIVQSLHLIVEYMYKVIIGDLPCTLSS